MFGLENLLVPVFPDMPAQCFLHVPGGVSGARWKGARVTGTSRGTKEARPLFMGQLFSKPPQVEDQSPPPSGGRIPRTLARGLSDFCHI